MIVWLLIITNRICFLAVVYDFYTVYDKNQRGTEVYSRTECSAQSLKTRLFTPSIRDVPASAIEDCKKNIFSLSLSLRINDLNNI